MYHGPRTDVLSFFSQLGLKCPQRKGVADFLQEVISKKDQQVSILIVFLNPSCSGSRCLQSYDICGKYLPSSQTCHRMAAEVEFSFYSVLHRISISVNNQLSILDSLSFLYKHAWRHSSQAFSRSAHNASCVHVFKFMLPQLPQWSLLSASFLQQFWASRHPYRYLASNEIAERFKFEFHAGIALTEELTQPFSPESQAENVSPAAQAHLLQHVCHQGGFLESRTDPLWI